MSKFIKGMDLSTLLELERCGAKYYEDGKEKDILDIMKEHDVDTIRLRLWNDPKSEDGEPYISGISPTATDRAKAKDSSQLPPVIPSSKNTRGISTPMNRSITHAMELAPF